MLSIFSPARSRRSRFSRPFSRGHAGTFLFSRPFSRGFAGTFLFSRLLPRGSCRRRRLRESPYYRKLVSDTGSSLSPTKTPSVLPSAIHLPQRGRHGRYRFLCFLIMAQARSPCAAGLNMPFAKGILSNKDNQARGRQSKLKSTNFIPHGKIFASAKRFSRNTNLFRKQGRLALRDPICLLPKAYRPIRTLKSWAFKQFSCTTPTLRGKIFASAKRFARIINLFREQGCLALRDPICAILGAYCS